MDRLLSFINLFAWIFCIYSTFQFFVMCVWLHKIAECREKANKETTEEDLVRVSKLKSVDFYLISTLVCWSWILS